MTGCWGGIKQFIKGDREGITDFVEDAVEVVQVVQEDAGELTQAVAEVLDTPFSVNLDDQELVFLLALAAKNSYSLSGECRGRLELRNSQAQDSEGNNMDNNIQFGVYEVLDGKHKGKKILAYRGTDLSDKGSAQVTLLQDASLALPSLSNLGKPIKEAISSAVEDALEQKPDFICGHSLGGLITECVCSETGIPGASFNAPGPGGTIPANNLLTGDKYKGVKFEVHLTEHDPVSLFGGMMGVAVSHVGKPIWHVGVGADNAIANHKMSLILNDLEKDL